MKMKKKFKTLKKIFCFLAVAGCLTLIKNSAIAMPKPVKLSNQLNHNSQKATPFNQEEIKKMVDNSWPTISANIDVKKPTFIMASGGGYGLDDEYRYPFKDENYGRKMNDFVYLLMYAIPKYLDEDITVLFVNKADQTIKIIDINKNSNVPTILPDIPLNPQGKYDKYYSGSNQMWAVKYLCEKFAEKQDAYIKEIKPIFDKKDEPVIDKKTNKPMYEILKVSFAPKTIAFLSLQTNSNNRHNSKGMIAFCSKNDPNGKLLSENITESSKHSLTNATVVTGNKEPVKETDKKITTKLGDFGLDTSLLFPDYVDNPETQFKFFDEDAIERCAMAIAKGINKYFNININFANTNFEPVYDDKHQLKYIKIKFDIHGYDVNNIESCSVSILDAENKEQMMHPEQFKQNLKIDNSGDRVSAIFKFDPTENNKHFNPGKNKHNKFYIKLYSENKNNTNVLVPNDTTNFKITIKNDGSLNIKPNAVYKNEK